MNRLSKKFVFPSPMDRTPNDPCVLITSRNVKKCIHNLDYTIVTDEESDYPFFVQKKCFESEAIKHGWNSVTWFGLSELLNSGVTIVEDKCPSPSPKGSGGPN